MNKTKAPDRPKHRPRRRGPGLFIFGTVFIVYTVAIGLFVERELFFRIMFYIQQKKLPPFGEFYPYQILLTMLFAFGLPLGMLFTFMYVIRHTEPPSLYVRRIILSGLGIFSIVILTPAFFGRELSNWFFGITGISILVFVLLTFWFSARKGFAIPCGINEFSNRETHSLLLRIILFPYVASGGEYNYNKYCFCRGSPSNRSKFSARANWESG